MSQSWRRNASWFWKAWKEYTRRGYEKSSLTFQAEDLDEDMSDVSCMITGANSGLGFVVASALAIRGATVHMVCRNLEKAIAAKDNIIQTGNVSPSKVIIHICDLSQSRDVLRFCSEFLGDGKPLDILVNNAGCIVTERRVNEDNFELNFATNTLGTYLITKGMIPLLERSKDGRIITVSTGGMLTMKLDPEDLNHERNPKFDGPFFYAQNKRGQLVIMRILSQQHPSIHFSTMHPGWADTPIVQRSLPLFHSLFKRSFRTPEQGADTALWLCVNKHLREFPTGLFYLDRQIIEEHLDAATHSTAAEENQFMENLENIRGRYINPQIPQTGATPMPDNDTAAPCPTTADPPNDTTHIAIDTHNTPANDTINPTTAVTDIITTATNDTTTDTDIITTDTVDNTDTATTKQSDDIASAENN